MLFRIIKTIEHTNKQTNKQTPTHRPTYRPPTHRPPNTDHQTPTPPTQQHAQICLHSQRSVHDHHTHSRENSLAGEKSDPQTPPNLSHAFNRTPIVHHG